LKHVNNSFYPHCSKTARALIVISHLRWNFVFQRPQHLMTRAAKTRPVFYIEEPLYIEGKDRLITYKDTSGVTVVTPHIQAGVDLADSQARVSSLLDELIKKEALTNYDLWIYTPIELPITIKLTPRVTVYDCMDELANFKGASPLLREREKELFKQADLVFTGGHCLYEAKSKQHTDVYPFPSSVEVNHFAQARTGLYDPVDQQNLPRPRLGFYGVIDERFDSALLQALARKRADWHFVLLGPVLKIDPTSLPRGANLHYLGMKSYSELPSYLANWDVALLPFARNEATEFISPTKTPEYLAAGVPVVSTGIRDVVRPYGERGIVFIADSVDAFEDACSCALSERSTPAGKARQELADAYLSKISWDRTWDHMSNLIEKVALRPNKTSGVARA
jgi:glycosyltransferase involved in cell wall biosynthesis